MLKTTPGKSRRSVQQAYNRAKSFMKMVALGKEQQQQQQAESIAASSICQPEPVRENGPRTLEAEAMEEKVSEGTKYHLYNDRLHPIPADGQHVSEDMNTQGHGSIDEEVPKSSQAFTGDEMPSTQGNIAGTANHIRSADNSQTTSSSATDGVVHDALGHEQSLLCQEDGVNLADSFRMGIKECRDQSFIAEDTTPMCSVDAPPKVHGVA